MMVAKSVDWTALSRAEKTVETMAELWAGMTVANWAETKVVMKAGKMDLMTVVSMAE